MGGWLGCGMSKSAGMFFFVRRMALLLLRSAALLVMREHEQVGVLDVV